jgi:hypothetical protein
MKLHLLFFIFLLSTEAQEFNILIPCDRFAFNRNIEVIRELVEHGEANWDLDNLELSFEQCGFNPINFGLGPNGLRNLRQRGNMQEYTRLHDDFMNYRNMDLEGLLAAAERAGQRVEAIERRARPHLEQARGRCGSVDIRDRLPPIRSQGSIGWCYSFTAADIASFHTGQNISPVDLAIKYNRIFMERIFDPGGGESEHDGGFDHIALRQGLQQGFCSEDQMAGTLAGDVNLYTRMTELEDAIDEFWETLALYEFYRDLVVEGLGDPEESPIRVTSYQSIERRLNRNPSLLDRIRVPPEVRTYIESLDDADSLRDHFSRSMICSNLSTFKEFFPHANLDEIVEVVLDSSRSSIVANMNNASCENPIFLEGEIAGLGIFSRASSRLDLAHQLMDDEQIFSASYHTSFIKQSGEGGNHVSSVVGRRWNEKRSRCEFMIRNS